VNVIVCMKQVPDTETLIKIKSDGSGIVTEDIKYVMNPYCEFAVEEALRIKEKFGGQAILVTMGLPKAVEALRTGLAMGADRSLHLNDPAFEGADGFATAKALAAAIQKEPFDLILCGKQAVDDDCAQVGPALAEFLGIPDVSVVTKLEVAADAKKITAVRETEAARETVECSLPALVTAQKGLNEPRYPSLPAIMKAKKMAIKTVPAAELGLGPEGAPRVEVLKFAEPPARKAGRVLEGEPRQVVKQVVTLLVEEARVL